MTQIDQKSTKLKRNVRFTAEVVSKYVSRNKIPSSELGALISSTFEAFTKLRNSTSIDTNNLNPAVHPSKSVRETYVVCLEDGMTFKSLRRHLMSSHGLTPEEYRAKWNLHPNHPIVAPEYSIRRQKHALDAGFGRGSAKVKQN